MSDTIVHCFDMSNLHMLAILPHCSRYPHCTHSWNVLLLISLCIPLLTVTSWLILSAEPRLKFHQSHIWYPGYNSLCTGWCPHGISRRTRVIPHEENRGGLLNQVSSMQTLRSQLRAVPGVNSPYNCDSTYQACITSNTPWNDSIPWLWSVPIWIFLFLYYQVYFVPYCV